MNIEDFGKNKPLCFECAYGLCFKQQALFHKDTPEQPKESWQVDTETPAEPEHQHVVQDAYCTLCLFIPGSPTEVMGVSECNRFLSLKDLSKSKKTKKR